MPTNLQREHLGRLLPSGSFRRSVSHHPLEVKGPAQAADDDTSVLHLLTNRKRAEGPLLRSRSWSHDTPQSPRGAAFCSDKHVGCLDEQRSDSDEGGGRRRSAIRRRGSVGGCGGEGMELCRSPSFDYGRRASEELEAAVSDAWETLERLDDLLLGQSVSGAGALGSSCGDSFVGSESGDGADCCRRPSGHDNDDDEENDSLKSELAELRESEDEIKKELEAMYLNGTTESWKLVREEEESDLQEWLRGGLIVEFPDQSGKKQSGAKDRKDGGTQREGNKEERRHLQGVVRALLQITNNVGLVLRLVAFWNLKRSSNDLSKSQNHNE